MTPQQIDDTLYRAATHQQSGRMKDAVGLYLSVLAVEPNNPVANHNLGVVAMITGRGLPVALPMFQTAWAADPSHQQHWLSLLRALVQAGQIPVARQVHAEGLRRGLQGPDVDLLLARIQPAAAAPNAGAATAATATAAELQHWQAELDRLLGAGQPAAAESYARTLLDRQPQLVWAWAGLSWALRAQQRHKEALQPLERAAQLQPDSAAIQLGLAQLTGQLGLQADAQAAFQRALALEPSHPVALRGLADLLLHTHRYGEAERLARQALQTDPTSADLYRLLGDVQLAQQQVDAALASYEKSWQLAPGQADSYRKLGALLHGRDDADAMVALVNQMLAAQPGQVEAYADLGRILLRAGRLEEAATAFAAYLHERPDDLTVRESWLFTCNYLARMTPQELLKEARIYGDKASAQAKPYTQWSCAPQPKTLRVGLVCGDLREHPVAYFLESVLSSADPQRIEWFAYSTSSERDSMTARLQQRTANWQSLVGLSHEESARRIHADGVHVLLDLAGHSALNALAVFAWRPAPVQASWLGYFATTGVAEMDFIIADRVGVPDSAQAYFSETVCYLPDTRLCFTPPQDDVAVAPLPALQRGHVTFGSFQVLRKLGDPVLSAWSRILERCPGSRLRIQNAELRSSAAQQTFRERLVAAGIDPARVDLHAPEARAQYLQQHAEVDLILDTFPFPGGTTTCEALWMGVPTVTLSGENLINRQGASLLSAAGLDDFIAESVNEYVALATAKAHDLIALAQLRRTLRAHLTQSPLLDAPRFARHLEDALWRMWAQRRA